MGANFPSQEEHTISSLGECRQDRGLRSAPACKHMSNLPDLHTDRGDPLKWFKDHAVEVLRSGPTRAGVAALQVGIALMGPPLHTKDVG
jgi:hypothetical protein